MYKKNFILIFAILQCVSTLIPPQFVRADGMMLPPVATWKKERERTLINEPSQKAAIFYRGGWEQLVISPSYQGPPGGFAWVVPVPKRPHVKILQGALFHELAEIVEPFPPPMLLSSHIPEALEPQKGVRVLERETVGAYDVSVLSATDGGALARWLKRNGYFLPPAAKIPLAAYVREKWTFVACRIKVAQNAHGLQSGTLAPLSLTFPTQKIIYPMRLSSVNRQPFHLLIYLMRPSPGQPLPDPGTPPFSNTAPPIDPLDEQYRYPDLVGFEVRPLTVHWIEEIVPPKSCVSDYVWHLPRKN